MKYIDQAKILNSCAKISHKSFRKGDIIIKQGDVLKEKLYIIIWGKVAVVLNFGGGGGIEIASGGKGGRGKQMHRKDLIPKAFDI